MLSTAILCDLIFFALTWATIRWIGLHTSTDALWIGTLRSVLTVAFVGLAGRYLFGDSWQKSLADDNPPMAASGYLCSGQVR